MKWKQLIAKNIQCSNEWFELIGQSQFWNYSTKLTIQQLISTLLFLNFYNCVLLRIKQLNTPISIYFFKSSIFLVFTFLPLSWTLYYSYTSLIIIILAKKFYSKEKKTEKQQWKNTWNECSWFIAHSFRFDLLFLLFEFPTVPTVLPATNSEQSLFTKNFIYNSKYSTRHTKKDRKKWAQFVLIPICDKRKSVPLCTSKIELVSDRLSKSKKIRLKILLLFL